MPSYRHEALIALFRNRPALAPELLRDVLHVKLPAYTEARIESADLTEPKPAEFRADLVVVLVRRKGVTVHGIVVEVQLTKEKRKLFAWPSYSAILRARFGVPVTVLVITVNEATARWAAKVRPIGGGNLFAPQVMRLSRIPAVTDVAQALADPGLAVLSVMAHGRDRSVRRAARIVLAAWEATDALFEVDPKLAELYFDIIQTSLSEAVRRELRAMDPAKYEYQSKFAKQYFAQGLRDGEAKGMAKGKAEGKAEGRAALIVRQLTLRFGPPSKAALTRISKASIEELDAIGERLLTAKSMKEALSTCS